MTKIKLKCAANVKMLKEIERESSLRCAFTLVDAFWMMTMSHPRGRLKIELANVRKG